MKPERAQERMRELMMERLYGEISSEDDAALATALHQDPELAREWEKLREVHCLVQGRLSADASPNLEAAIRGAARTLPAAPRRLPWTRFAAAASVLIVLGVAAMHYISDPLWTHEKTEVSIATPRQEIDQRLDDRSMQPAPAAEPDALGYGMAMRDADETPKQAPAARLATRDNGIDPQNAREVERLFRTALEVYNQAFTKVGSDREALLRSAIVLLRDVDEAFPNQREWTDMALLLIADAHRQLDETDAALQACLTLAERRPIPDSLALQARTAAVEILISEHKWEEANRELSALFELQSGDNEAAALALTLARRLIDEQPEAALHWLNRLQDTWPPSHPFHVKANDLHKELIRVNGSAFSIRDWWAIGPMPLGALYSEVMPEQSNNPHSPPASVTRPGNAQYDWLRIRTPPQSNLNLLNMFERPQQYASAFLTTYVYSPTEQSVFLYCMYRPLMHAWLNGERMANAQWLANHTHAYPFTGVLPKGWSQLLIQTGFTPSRVEDHWTVTVFLLDDHGRIATDLTVTATPWEE